MRKHTAAENKAKHSSPTKRKWNTKVADLLAKTFDRFELAQKDKGQDPAGRTALQYETLDALLKRCEGLADLGEVDQLIEEAATLTIPAQNDNLKKLQELKGVVGELHKEIEKFNDKKTEHKLSKYSNLLKKVVDCGVQPVNLDAILGFSKRNCEVLRCIQQVVSLSTLETLLADTEKYPKLYDQELVDQLAKKKDRFRKAIVQAEEILRTPQLCIIDENKLTKLIAEIHKYQFDFEAYEKLAVVAELVQNIRNLVPFLFPGNIHDELDRQEELSDLVQRCTFRLKKLLEEEASEEKVRFMEQKSAELRGLVERVNLDDPEVTSLLAKMESVVWRHQAKATLERNDENEDELVKLLQDTPKDIASEGCREYSQIKERVHAIQAAQSNEKRIVDKLDQYWEDEQLHLKIAEITAFVQETKNYILKKKIERKLEVLEQVAVALQNVSSTKNKEDLVDEMSDLKLQGTKVFQRLSAIAKSSEKAEKNINWLRQNKKKLQNYRESSVTPSMRGLLEMPKMKLSQAKEILTFLKGLPQSLKVDYEADLKALDAEIFALTAVSQEAESLLKQFLRQKFLDMKYSSEEVRSCIERLRTLVKRLFESNYKDENVETKLGELDLLVKSACLLDRAVDPQLKRDISSWESTLKLLREWSKDDQKNNLMKAIKLKMDKAEKIMMEVHRMRQYEAQFSQSGSKLLPTKILTRQNRMPSIEEAKALLKSYQEDCYEIELEDTCGYLKAVIDTCEDRIAHANGAQLSITELQTLQEQLKKAPLNVESLTYELNERVSKAQEFVKKVKHMSPETLANEMENLKAEYQKLAVKVPEFEKLKEQFYSELEKTRTADLHLERLSLQQTIRLRQDLMSHQFFRDRGLETKILLRQVQMLEDELSRRSEGFEDDAEVPVIDMASLETVQKELLEIRKNSRVNYSNKGQFLSKLVNDVKTFLNEHIYSLGLDGVCRLRSYSYRKLVDLTKEITDHKIKLEISQNPVDRSLKKKEGDDSKKYDKFGLFGTDFALVSRVEPVEDPKHHPYHIVDELKEAKSQFGDRPDPSHLASEADKKDALKKKKIEGPYQDPKKPDMSLGLVSSSLRQYFSNAFKTHLEKNESFEISGLDALMAANTLERQIYDKYLDKLKEYDETCEAVCKVLRNLVFMKYLSIHIRNKNFRLSILIKLIDKDKTEMKKIDAFARQKLEKNKGPREDQEIKVVDEEDELLENLGEQKDKEENNLHFSDLDSEGEAEEAKVNDITAVVPKSHPRGPRALSYDPETGQYQRVKNKYLNPSQNADYTFYQIFKGGVYFETKEKIDLKKKPEKTKMFSCTGEDFIKYFTEIPDGLQLSAHLSRFEFEQYIQKVLVSDQALNYLVLPLWIETATPLTFKNFYKTHECVGSIQYSPRCKVFIFPKEYLRQEWLSVINFHFVKKDLALTELVGFIVLKLVNADSYEVNIIPDPVKVEKNHRAYKFVRSHTDVSEKIIDIELLRENKHVEELEASPKKAASRFFEEVLEFPEDDRKNPKKGPLKNKLQRLMANELSTTQSPHSKVPSGHYPPHEDLQAYGNAGLLDSLKPANPKREQPFASHPHHPAAGNLQLRDDLDSQDNLSRLSDDFDNPGLGKRLPSQRPHMGQHAPQHLHLGQDFGRQGPPGQQSYKPRPGAGLPVQAPRGDRQDPFGGQAPLGAPNKQLKRDYNPPGRQPGPGKQFGFGQQQQVSSFDMNMMGDLDAHPGYPKQSANLNPQFAPQQQRQSAYQSAGYPQMPGPAGNRGPSHAYQQPQGRLPAGPPRGNSQAQGFGQQPPKFSAGSQQDLRHLGQGMQALGPQNPRFGQPPGAGLYHGQRPNSYAQEPAYQPQGFGQGFQGPQRMGKPMNQMPGSYGMHRQTHPGNDYME